MKRFEFCGRLSKAVYQKGFAACPHCMTFYFDDLPLYGSVMCPECTGALHRGLTWLDASSGGFACEVSKTPGCFDAMLDFLEGLLKEGKLTLVQFAQATEAVVSILDDMKTPAEWSEKEQWAKSS
jgi:hypothetical protein